MASANSRKPHESPFPQSTPTSTHLLCGNSSDCAQALGGILVCVVAGGFSFLE